MGDEELTAAQKALLDRARKGVLKFVFDRGGNAPLGDMHQFSELTFFIAHQSFSRMMERFVKEGFLLFDAGSQKATLTDTGRAFLSEGKTEPPPSMGSHPTPGQF